ncbi:MAG: hypothetical protein ABJH68_15505 [Ilumatobacter sp.]|uniref:fibronectin type III domain-containing protein n=1 Tax=Ilumatobacter sp. TaxID=1967498 RepID=UPI0032995296
MLERFQHQRRNIMRRTEFIGASIKRTALAAAVLASVLVFVAPGSTQAQAVTPIPDDGLPAATIAASPLVSTRTEVLQAGVVGVNKANDTFTQTDISVAAFAEIGNTIYVGGKFTQVEIAATRQRHNQPFLAAFDRTTGAWIDTFRPTINGNVWDLKATNDGRLIVAGQFTTVNGQPNTTAVAMLDATTGALDPTWRVSLALTGSTRWPLARTLDIEGNALYIGGNFTRATGANGVQRSVGQIARVNLSSGVVDTSFRPQFDGIIFDIDATADRVNVAGNFLYVNGTFSIGIGILSPADGSLVPGLTPWVRTSVANTTRSYQQAILAVGDQVWQGGSEHNRQVYRASDYGLIRSWVSNPYGDGQSLAELNGIVYAGSHANGNTFLYQDAYRWPALTGATSNKPERWMSAFDTANPVHLDWYPAIGTRYGEGSWALFADSSDCLWTGGDFNRGSYDGNTPRYVEGFAKFCSADSTAPAPPSSPIATAIGGGVNLEWTASTGDDRGGLVRYELLKNDSVFASYIGITTFRDPNGTSSDRYFVRAMDVTGNRSATTRVFTASDIDTTRPSIPEDLAGVVEDNGDVTLTWTASTDDVAVAGYKIFRNSVEIAETTDPTYVVPAPGEGDHWYQVLAFDTSGNLGFKNQPVKVTVLGADTVPPQTPADLAGVIEDNGDVTLTWTPPTDDVGVTGYIVFRNGVEIATVTEPTHVVPAPGPGDHFYQVLAFDAAGNQGAQTPSLLITVAPDPALDVTPPNTPRDLVGAIQPNGDVTLTWTPSVDNVAVTGYIVFRNSVEIARVTDPTHTVPAPGAGSHWYQVRAFDAAGNEGFKTPSTRIDI